MLSGKDEMIAVEFWCPYQICLGMLQFWGHASALLLGRKFGGFEEALEESIAKTFEAKLGLKFNFDDGVEKCFG